MVKSIEAYMDNRGELHHIEQQCIKANCRYNMEETFKEPEEEEDEHGSPRMNNVYYRNQRWDEVITTVLDNPRVRRTMLQMLQEIEDA